MNIEIANRLQKLRKENGYSQEELADELGISRQAVSKWERAESSPDTNNLILLARLYNMSLDDLLSTNDTNEEIKESNNDEFCITDDEGQKIKIEDGKLAFYDENGNKQQLNKRNAIKAAIEGIIVLLTVIAFFVLSFSFGLWRISWIIFVLMPAVLSIIDCIDKKRFTAFAYPVLITAIYLFIGMKYSFWHPHWLLFLTVPVYYLIFDPIDKYVLKTKGEDE